MIIKSQETLSFANPGDMRISLAMAMEGGFSDPRNATLMKMFGMIGVGERAGSGVPNIIATWENETQRRPSYKIMYSPERVMCTIFVVGSGSETSDKISESGSKSGLKTQKWPKKWPKKWPNYADVIMEAIERNSKVTIDQLVALLPVGNTTTDKVLNAMQSAGYIRHDGPSNGGEWIVLQFVSQ